MNTRALATQIIFKVCFDGISLTEAFDQAKIPEADRPFVKEMCFGTIRFWITLQAILKTLLEKPLKNEDKDIECLLCVGLYQILYMHVPEYALVDESVTATRLLQKSWASGLVNKILRMAIDLKNNDSLKAKGITAEFSHPLWIIEKLQKAYPDQWQAILKANNEKAPLFLRVNQTQISRAKFESLLQKNAIDYTTIDGLQNAIRLTQAMPVEKIPGFFQGYFSVQDASGQKVVDYLDLQPNQTVLDACAAPGSKTTHILETMPTIAQCIAVDLYSNRLSKVQENITRLKLDNHKMDYVVDDVCNTDAWWHKKTFDRILVDAPCSASGVIRRHPDIKLLRKKMDIPNLAATQLSMLNTLWPLLKKGGKLVYTTCSVFPDENSDVIRQFLSVHTEATLTVEHQAITGDADGFYYAVLENS